MYGDGEFCTFIFNVLSVDTVAWWRKGEEQMGWWVEAHFICASCIVLILNRRLMAIIYSTAVFVCN